MKLWAIKNISDVRYSKLNVSVFLHKETAERKCYWCGGDLTEINIENVDTCGKYIFHVYGYYGYRYNLGLPSDSGNGITDVIHDKYYTNITDALHDSMWLKAEADVLNGKSTKKSTEFIQHIYTTDEDSNPFTYGENGEGYYIVINKIRVIKEA